MFKVALLLALACVASADVKELLEGRAHNPARYHPKGGHVAVARTASSDSHAQILRQSQDVSFDGTFNYGFETDNGIKSEVSGVLKHINAEEDAQVMQGQYEYYTPEGEHVVMSYISDENGYQPQGSHIPTPPPTPDHIVRALKYIFENQQKIKKI